MNNSRAIHPLSAVTGLLLLVSASCTTPEIAQPIAPQSEFTPMELPQIHKLREPPRLFDSDMKTLNDNLHSPYLKERAKRILLDADELAEEEPIAEGEASSYLAGSRQIRSNISTLTGAWALTHNPKYRKAAIRYLGSLMNWNQISCEANSGTPPDAQMFFCLIYGEQSAEIGIMYDIFRPDITPEEQQVFFDVLNRFHLKEALRCLEHPPWWVNKEWSNWNGVCAGGMGIMALAFYEDLPEVRKLIPFVEESLGYYFHSYVTNGGGCHEGTGYWNYGLHYSIRYLLYWEYANARKHPDFEIKELGKTLYFPLDFKGISFGDNDGWGPNGFFFELAKRMNEPAAALKAATRLPASVDLTSQHKNRFWTSSGADHIYSASAIPSPEEVDALTAAHKEKKVPVARVYDGLGWAVLADDEVIPSLHLAARGGSSKISGHGMLDLLSFKCMLNNKLMITDQTDGYNPVTFTSRGIDLYGRSAASKSTIFVDGLGCEEDVECRTTEVVTGKDLLGIRIDGSGIYMPHWRRYMFIGRLFLMVENKYWIVIDRAFSRNRSDRHWLESRFHTFAACEKGPDWVSLRVGDQDMMMTFASLGKTVIQESKGLPIAPAQQTTVLRLMGTGPSADNMHVTAMNPGNKKLSLKISKDAATKQYVITVTGDDNYTRIIRVSSDLKLIEE